MKLLFVYGTKVKADNDYNYYTGGTLPSSVWKERYGFISKDITFIGNLVGKCNDSELKKMNKVDSTVNFVGINKNLNTIVNVFSSKVRKSIKETIKREVEKSDIVIARVPDIYSYYAIDYALKLKKKIIVEVVGCAWDSLWNHGLRGKLVALPLFIKMKKHVYKSPNVIYVSNEFLQKRYPTKGKWISCSDVILNGGNKRSIKKTFNTNNRIIGTCGAIDVDYKGQKYVIAALSELIKRGNNNIEYQLVGGGSPKKIEKLIKKYHLENNVRILGPIPHDEVFDWLDSIDIYIQPSNLEGMCRALIEAMSRGCPCIASNVGGNPELLDNRFLFKKKNVKQLTKLIEEMDLYNMNNQSIINYKKSKTFMKEVLDKKREVFYNSIIAGK